jgi:helix-turn-helix protein
MSSEERPVADFVGRFALDIGGGERSEPVDGRVVMSQRRIVFASEADRTTVPLSAVVDIITGHVPKHLRDLFDETVTLAYRDGSTTRTALVEGDGATIDRFRQVLFKSLINGTEAVVEHPAQVGGRMTDESARPAKLRIGDRGVEFATPDGRFSIDPATVIDFDRIETAPNGETRPTLVVQHSEDGTAVTSLLAPSSKRLVNLLGRYLRLEYDDLRRAVADLDLTADEKRVLVGVYATGGDVDFAGLLDGDAARVTRILNGLERKDLVESGTDSIELTSEGRVVVTERIEDVNV